MTQYKDLFCVTDNLNEISNACFEHEIELGSGKKYGVWWDEKPYAVITVEESRNPFDDAYIFGGKLYIGNNDELIIIDLRTFDYHKLPCELYFGYFFEYQSFLFVASSEDVICFKRNGEVNWQTEKIAIDGITFCGCDDGQLEVSCCMDPCPAL